MICSQLTQLNQTLAHVSPRPSSSDLTRIICKRCNRIESCPSLSAEQAEAIMGTEESQGAVEG